MLEPESRSNAIRDFILRNVSQYPRTIAKALADAFGISRQAANKHLAALVAAGLLTASGTTKGRVYRLAVVNQLQFTVPIDERIAEDAIWRERIASELAGLPRNVYDIWQYGCTEMLNNAIDHSGGSAIAVRIIRTGIDTEIMVADDGVGIFRKIQRELGLADPREGILELAKGKLTTDPSRHTGEGIFFSSRMYDEFSIVSAGLYFSHQLGAPDDWLLQASQRGPGTAVYMRLANHSTRTTTSVFDAFASPQDEYAFRSTIVPVRLAQIGGESLVSRSQAKRLVARFEQFRKVVLDFSGVEAIGQAFADEVFRVFAAAHPSVELIPNNANATVTRMIRRAQAARGDRSSPPG
jgi:anti-sigma regulatory factor (Ser/Thr protein kinase)/biotin operon repressor